MKPNEVLNLTGISRKELAKKLDLSKSTIEKWSCGQNEIPKKHWDKLMRVSKGRITWEMLENLGGNHD